MLGLGLSIPQVAVRRVGSGAPSVPPPSNGVFFDSANGDSFAQRMDYPASGDLAVTASQADFASPTAVARDLRLKDVDGALLFNAFDNWAIDATYQVTSFPAADVTGFHTGGVRNDAAEQIFTGETKAHPGSATILYRRLWLNNAVRVSGASSYAFAPGVTARVQVSRAGDQFTVTQTFAGSDVETLTRTMVLTATSDELPRLFLHPFVRFVQGNHRLTAFKFTAGFANVRFGFLGDSITQGRFANGFASGFAQLIRNEWPTQVLVAGAPAASTTDWLNATYSFCRMRPQIAFVLLGANDIAQGASEATIQANLTTIRNRLIDAGITPVMLRPTPMNSIKATNIGAWIAAQGWANIDTYTPLVGSGTALAPAYDSGDGLHPNEAGHAAIRSAVRAWIIANSPTGFDFSGAALPAGAAVGRASQGYRFNSAGLLVPMAADVARFDYNPATLAFRGLLLEGQRTNYNTASSDFSLWTLNNLTADQLGGVTAPDGSTAWRLTDVAGGNGYIQRNFSAVAGQVPAAVFAKAGTHGIIRGRHLSFVGMGGADLVQFNLNTGVVTGAGIMDALPGGWYRCQFTATIDAGDVSGSIRWETVSVAGAAGTNTVFVFGGTDEGVGPEASSYIATTGATATRPQDVLTLNWGAQGVADGALNTRVTFDNMTTQDVAQTVAGGSAQIVGGTLNRRWVRKIEKI